MERIAVSPQLLRWASQRARLPWESLLSRFKQLGDWEGGLSKPTLNQLRMFASATHVPFGDLLLREPPAEPLPLPDFRTISRAGAPAPSGDLLDTIYACQIRQEWYRDYARGRGPIDGLGEGPDDLNEATARLTAMLRITDPLNRRPENALAEMIVSAEAAGLLVMASGVVGNNTRRKLLVEEFRGFVIYDKFAPLVFINAADRPRAQLFTLVHEMAHLLRGQSAVSEVRPEAEQASLDETWCNRVAAALLVPETALRAEISQPGGELSVRLRQRFPVSAAVSLIRALELGLISPSVVSKELELPWEARPRNSSGGNFYRTQLRRLGRRFPTAVVESTLEGRTLFSDALHLLGLSSERSFERLASHLGID